MVYLWGSDVSKYSYKYSIFPMYNPTADFFFAVEPMVLALRPVQRGRTWAKRLQALRGSWRCNGGCTGGGHPGVGPLGGIEERMRVVLNY